MPYFVLFYEVVKDFKSKPASFRQDHLCHARQAQARGELFFAGALADLTDRALLVFHTEDYSAAESFCPPGSVRG